MTFGEKAADLAGLAGAILGWRPNDFWNATPRELETALMAGAAKPDEIMGRAEMDRLAKLFPDNRDM